MGRAHGVERSARARRRAARRGVLRRAPLALLWLSSALCLAAVACSPAATPSDGASAGGADAARTSAEPDARSDAAGGAKPRLIVLISLDTLRPDHMSLYGYERFTTPVIDTFALDGVVFEDASAVAPWTLPSHASMLTGLYPLKHGVVTMVDALPKEIPTLATLLRDAGYRTAAVVNSTWLKQLKYRVTKDFEKYLLIDEVPERRAPNTWVTDQAITWLREASSEPLFLFMHYYDIHTDYVSEPVYEKLFVSDYHGKADGTSWQLTAASLDDDYVEMCRKQFDPEVCRFGTRGEPNRVDENMVRLEFDERDVQHLVDLYDASIRQTDAELSRFFGFLDTEGLSDEAVVIVTSDHGEEFKEHGRFEHFLATHQELLHVPLVFRGPGVPKGVRVAAPVSLVDLVPTVLGLAHADVPSGLDGRDLAPLWWEAAADDPDALVRRPSRAFESRYLFGEAAGGITYAQMMGDGLFPIYRSVRQGRYKLIHVSKPAHYALYDLASDPLEQADVSAAHPDVVAALREVLARRYDDVAKVSEGDPANRVELDPEELEKLRALGYVP